jgi:hypothetical protein
MMAEPITEPTSEPPLPEIAQPDAPPEPTQQTFKCEKCGATFEDEGSAAAHIQECKGTDVVLADQEPQKT